MLERIKVWRPAELGDLELRRGTAISEPYPRHWHEEYQLCLVVGGGGELIYRGSHHATPTSSFFIVHPDEVHANNPDPEAGCSFRSIYISPETLRRLNAELVDHPQGLPFFPQPMIFDREILDLYFNLHLALEQPHSRLLGESLLLELFARLLTRYAQPRSSIKASGREPQAIKRVREYLTAAYAENVSLDQLARLASLSPFHLNRIFCREVGMPPHAFQTQVRIAHAKALLRQGRSISQVAMLTGFADQSHFTRHFKRLVHLTPGQYSQDSKNVQDRPSARC